MYGLVVLVSFSYKLWFPSSQDVIFISEIMSVQKRKDRRDLFVRTESSSGIILAVVYFALDHSDKGFA